MEIKNKNDILILRSLFRYNKTDMLKSITIKDLTEKLKMFSSMKIRTTLKYFVVHGLVAIGFKQGNSNTYYITEKGINLLKELVKEEDDI